MRDLSVFAGWFGLRNDEFLLPWASISAEQLGGLDTNATGLESTQVIVAGHITVEPQQRRSYLTGCVRIVEQASGTWLPRRRDPRGPGRPGRVNIFVRWESQPALETFRSSGPDPEQRPPMLTVSVREHNIADVRPVFGTEAE